jgi:Cu+-exporting ATPase
LAAHSWRAATSFSSPDRAPAEQARRRAEQLVAAGEAVGYSATLPAAPTADEHAPEGDETWPLRLIGSALLSVPVLHVWMIPTQQFNHWQWLACSSRLRSCSGRPGQFHLAA